MTAGRLRGTLVPASAPSPLQVRTDLARKHYDKMCITFGNGEATMAELVEAAERLRDLQLRLKVS